MLFEDLSFDVDGHAALQIRGANGTGKTTLLRAVCGLTRPVEGRIRWRSAPVDDDPQRFRADLVYVGHTDGIKLELTPRENLECSRALLTHPTEEPVAAILERVGLRGFEDITARRLSAGQRRRVSLARLVLGQARLWLLDEPFTALDRRSTEVVLCLLESHLRSGGALLFSSHQEMDIAGGPVQRLELP